MATISASGEGERIPAGPTVSIVRVPGADTDEQASVVELHLDAGWEGPPPHVHGEVAHCWYVLEGEVTLCIDGRNGHYGAGACLWVPAGTPHGFTTADGPAAIVLQVDTGRALDGYLRDLREAIPRGTPPDPTTIAEIMSRHDTIPVNA